MLVYALANMALTRLESGQVFAGDFEVLRPLAEGGMGAVYVARQRSTGHERALKVMHASIAADALSRAKFEQEARVGARVESDHVVQVVAAGYDEPTSTPWLAMELLRGEDLASLLRRRGGLPVGEARMVLSQVGHALSAAHRIGLVHRDLKPENVFVAESRRTDNVFTVKVLDFGIAKLLQENRTAATATTAMGSPLWMSPEQTERQGKISPATDVWAYGLVAFASLTGRSYWLSAEDETATMHAILREILIEPLEPASRRAASRGATLPEGFDGWFSRCVARDAAQRFRDGGEACAALMPLLGEGARASVTSAPPANVSGHGGVAQTQALVTSPQTQPLVSTAWVPPPAYPASVAPRGGLLKAFLFIGGVFVVVVGVLIAYFAWSYSRTRAELEAQMQREDDARRVMQERERAEEERAAAEAAERRQRAEEEELARARAGAEAAAQARAAALEAESNPARSPQRLRETRVPTVRAAPPSVAGLLPPDVIRRVVLRNLGQVNHCYEQGLAQDPSVAGRVTVRFVIGGTGEVLASAVTEDTLASPSVGQCIAASVRRWRFPAPEGGGVVTVNYPFTLTSR